MAGLVGATGVVVVVEVGTVVVGLTRSVVARTALDVTFRRGTVVVGTVVGGTAVAGAVVGGTVVVGTDLGGRVVVAVAAVAAGAPPDCDAGDSSASLLDPHPATEATRRTAAITTRLVAVAFRISAV